ncbi:MAG: hypothetical protein JNL61_05585 [Rhizobiaceae bacterium]|nr:hypothetical protein [Rhizobiaceae bacterium]
MPHAWLYRHDNGSEISALDLCGHGRFTILTGPGGEAWAEAAKDVAAELGLGLVAHVIGLRQRNVDYSGEWARVYEIRDSGCLVVRPDHHVAWCTTAMSGDPRADLGRVLKRILGG